MEQATIAVFPNLTISICSSQRLIGLFLFRLIASGSELSDSVCQGVALLANGIIKKMKQTTLKLLSNSAFFLP